MAMCGGDGIADVFGRLFGSNPRLKLYKGSDKSWPGSVAMFGAGLLFGLAFVNLYERSGNFQGTGFELFFSSNLVPLSWTSVVLSATFVKIVFIMAVATVIEALPFRDIDNITITASIMLLGKFLL